MDVVLVMEKQKKKDHVLMQNFHNFVEPGVYKYRVTKCYKKRRIKKSPWRETLIQFNV